MSDLPSHSESTGNDATDDVVPPTARWKVYAGVTVGIVVLVVFIGLHLTGVVGPAGH